MSAIDDACRELAALAKAEGIYCIEVRVTYCGRVEVRRTKDSWDDCGTAYASVRPDSAYPLPSVALAVRKGAA